MWWMAHNPEIPDWRTRRIHDERTGHICRDYFVPVCVAKALGFLPVVSPSWCCASGN
jgi:hypothetical protein